MDQRLAARFSLFDTSIVSDALDEFGIDGVITGIEPADPGHAVAGRATTVAFEPATGDEATNFPYAMLEAMAPNRVLVLDGIDPDVSCWGGRASELAANAAVAGVVVDGGFRDVGEIRGGSLPVFGRRPTPRTGQRRMRVDAVGEPVTIDGVTIEPESVVVADATGIVVVPPSHIGDVLDRAEEILGEELVLERKIDRGATVSDLKTDDHAF